MRILIAGAQGFIGTALSEHLRDAGHEVVALVRRPAGEGEITWDPQAGDRAVDIQSIEGFNAVVNLAGVPLADKRWNEDQKRLLWESRIKSTEALATAIGRTEFRPSVFVSASAVGYYGDRGSEALDETSSNGEGFLAQLCAAWELASQPASEIGIRTANIRSGIVLGPQGGALAQQIPVFKIALGGRLGSGEQFLSWITIDDHVRAIAHIIETDGLDGPVNLTAPKPVKNKYFTKALGEVMRRPTLVPAPRWMIAAAFGGELADEMLLASQIVFPERLQESGFEFEDEDLLPALYKLLRPVEPKDDEAEDAVDITDQDGKDQDK